MWREWWKQTASQFPPPLEPVETLSLNSAALPAPDMAMQTIDGTEIDLEQFRGKIVLLNFWATWCPPCAQELPALGELARKYPDTLVVLGVNLDGYVAHDSSDRVVGGVRRFIAEHKVDYPVLMDNSGEMARRFGGEVLPTTAWIDAGGIVRRRYTNPRALPGMEQILAELSGAEKSVQ
jgi:thiol-disulfide isomerase/thioredoxin